MNDYEAKQHCRPHCIRDWMDCRQVSQAELAKRIGANKSLVSRWLAGSTPSVQYQQRLAAFFEVERDEIFLHPGSSWIASFLKGRSTEEMERIKAVLKAAFPRE